MVATTQNTFLADKLARCVQEDPRWNELAPKLLKLGGREVVACFEEDMANLLSRGQLWEPRKVVKKPGRPRDCHANSGRVVAKDPAWSIVTGYALSDDGLWRQHSWCIHGGANGQPLKLGETTTSRVAYFGFKLTPDEAQAFIYANR